MPHSCCICRLAETDPDKLAAINKALRTRSHRGVGATFHYSPATVWNHLAHSPEVIRGRKEATEQLQQGIPVEPPERTPARGADRLEAKVGARLLPPAPVKVKRNRNTAAQINDVDLQQKVWQLRIAYKSFPQIAMELGLRLSSGEPDVGKVYRLLERARERLSLMTQESIIASTMQELDRLDEIAAVLRPRALEGRVVITQDDGTTVSMAVELEAMDRATLLLLQVGDRRAKLLGLNADSKTRRRANELSGLSGGGPNQLPPRLAALDPPPSNDEILHYVETGEVPRRTPAPNEQSYLGPPELQGRPRNRAAAPPAPAPPPSPPGPPEAPPLPPPTPPSATQDPEPPPASAPLPLAAEEAPPPPPAPPSGETSAPAADPAPGPAVQSFPWAAKRA